MWLTFTGMITYCNKCNGLVSMYVVKSSNLLAWP